MSTLASRRGGEKSLQSSLLALAFRFRFVLVSFGAIILLGLGLLQLHVWSSHSGLPGFVEATNLEEELLEPMSDFLFKTDETKWIDSGRKTKRIHVVDKVDQVEVSRLSSLLFPSGCKFY